MRIIELPTVDEVLRELPLLLVTSGELTPRPLHGPNGKPVGSDYTYPVARSLSPAWSNPDFDPELGDLDTLERHHLLRQIERTHRDYHLEPRRRSPWVLRKLGVASLADWTIQDGDEPWGVLALEVPVFTIDRRRAVLRGQRTETFYAEDFEHRLEKVKGRWTRSA